MQHVSVQQFIPAPPHAVWDQYTDHVSWTHWAGLGKVHLERQGDPAPNGTGCVRIISSAGVSVAEEVLAFEIPKRMTYRILRGGLPIKDHLGEVNFKAQDEGTLITWRCQFNSRIPGLGGIFQRVITYLFRSALRGLARLPHLQR